MNKKYLFIIILIQCCCSSICFGQEVMNLVDPFTKENATYIRAETFEDGTKMTVQKCDGVIYIQNKGNFYKRQFSGAINIKWFGAKGDGNINDIGTDDSQAIKTALKVISEIYKTQQMSGGNLFGGFVLYFPAGIYIVNETFILPDGISIEGDSYINTLIHTKQPRFLFTNVRGMSKNGIDVLMSTDIAIKNLTLKQGGLELQGAANSVIQNVRIMNLFGGDKTDTGLSIKLPVNLRIKDVKIFGSTGVGIKYEDTAGTGPSTSTTFDHVWVSHCKLGMFVNGNTGGSHGILTSRIYNSIFEYNETGIVMQGNIENFVMRDIHLEQNKNAINISGDVNMVMENIWSDKGNINLKNSNKNKKNNAVYLKNVNLPQIIDRSYQGKIINN